MTRKAFAYGTAILTVILTTPVGSMAAPAVTAPIASRVISQREEAQQASYELRDTAARLHAITRGGRISWQSHSL
jgi:hypothetical protein